MPAKIGRRKLDGKFGENAVAFYSKIGENAVELILPSNLREKLVKMPSTANLVKMPSS
jgi:hypothetical protein